ncbi:MAG TPA: YfiR family protein [Elusimicrobiales bacterium]|nr:YfiR family protein [Elusimicrobiales bacterium]
MSTTAPGRERGTAGEALCLLALLALFPAPAPAETGDLEAGVKAAYIYNFTRFVEWEVPASTGAAPAAGGFTVCALGEGPVTSALGALEGRKAGGSAIKVTRYREAARLSSCRILFISRSAEKGLERTLAALGPGTLTVSDIPGFARKGGIIGFFMDDKKVRIEVDPRRAGEAGLKLSPRLLQVSKIIGDPR